MFVVDTLDASWFEDMLLPNEEYKKSLKDFTYFDDAVAGGAPTVLAIPTLLTGKIDMDASRDTSEYYKDAYEVLLCLRICRRVIVMLNFLLNFITLTIAIKIVLIILKWNRNMSFLQEEALWNVYISLFHFMLCHSF
mgnify:CR=1 FL=1